LDVLIVGASTRVAAFTERRARIDRFADRDLASICPGRRVTPEDDPDGLEDLAAEPLGALARRPRCLPPPAGSPTLSL
jgi:uncharacterized protein